MQDPNATLTLYLIRHGIAAERGTYAQDCDRPLTATGLEKTRQVAKRLKEFGVACDRLLTSPLVRAQQTAQILVETGLSPGLDIAACLAPDGAIDDWLAWLQSSPPLDSIALVGHEPNLSLWAECLIWGGSHGGLMLKKAGIIGLTLPQGRSPLGHSTLFWLAPPRLILS
jgi:phosphohistidine phosphatase